MNDGLVGLAIENQGDVIIARLTGELDIAGAPSTGEQIGQAVPNSALGLVVDMSELEFIDSSGVAMLFGLVRRLSSRRQELRVVARRDGRSRVCWRSWSSTERRRSAGTSRGSGRDLLSGERHLGWDGVHNARDLGGLSIAGGGETRWGAVIRATCSASSPRRLGRPRLTASARSSICATTTRSSGRAARPRMRTIHLPHDAIALWDGYEEWQAGTLYYAGHLECFPERSARVIAAVASASGRGGGALRGRARPHRSDRSAAARSRWRGAAGDPYGPRH